MEPNFSLRLSEPHVDFPHAACGRCRFPMHLDECVAKMSLSSQQAGQFRFTLNPQDLRPDPKETLKCVLNKMKITFVLV